MDVLRIAGGVMRERGISNDDRFRVAIVSASGATVRPVGGVAISTSRAPRDLGRLVVPGFELLPGQDLDTILGQRHREVAFIRRAASRSVPLASVCVGAFLLGEAGVLDGREATTGWLFAKHMAARYPRTTVHHDELLVQHGPVTTTGAFSAVFDLAIRLIREHAGDDIARATARVALVADNRTSQAPHVDDALRPEHSTPFSVEVKRWLVADIQTPYDLAALARAMKVSTRTLLRRFATETGESPLAFLQRARVETAKRLLEAPDARVADVMEQVGYHDAGAFRQLFSRHVDLTPAAYRRQFATNRDTTQSRP